VVVCLCLCFVCVLVCLYLRDYCRLYCSGLPFINFCFIWLSDFLRVCGILSLVPDWIITMVISSDDAVRQCVAMQESVVESLQASQLEWVPAFAQQVLRRAIWTHLGMDMWPLPVVGVFGSRAYGLFADTSDLDMYAFLPNDRWHDARAVRAVFAQLLRQEDKVDGRKGGPTLQEDKQTVSWKFRSEGCCLN
jgi:hypothetical protein